MSISIKIGPKLPTFATLKEAVTSAVPTPPFENPLKITLPSLPTLPANPLGEFTNTLEIEVNMFVTEFQTSSQLMMLDLLLGTIKSIGVPLPPFPVPGLPVDLFGLLTADAKALIANGPIISPWAPPNMMPKIGMPSYEALSSLQMTVGGFIGTTYMTTFSLAGAAAKILGKPNPSFPIPLPPLPITFVGLDVSSNPLAPKFKSLSMPDLEAMEVAKAEQRKAATLVIDQITGFIDALPGISLPFPTLTLPFGIS